MVIEFNHPINRALQSPDRGEDHHRSMATALQHDPSAHLSGLSPASAIDTSGGRSSLRCAAPPPGSAFRQSKSLGYMRTGCVIGGSSTINSIFPLSVVLTSILWVVRRQTVSSTLMKGVRSTSIAFNAEGSCSTILIEQRRSAGSCLQPRFRV